MPRRASLAWLAVLGGWLAFAAPALRADVTLPKIIGDNMVLQRGGPVPIWGQASPGEAVTVLFAGQQKRAVTDPTGHWQVMLDALPASAEPRDMTITGNNSLQLKNILVGEVWLCGGQSNMEYAVNRSTAGAPAATSSDALLAQEIEHPDYPDIRLFRVEKKVQPPDVVSSGWTACSGDALDIFSAIGFFFARDIQRVLGVPVGVIQSAWGGSRIEPWTPADAYAPLPAFHAETEKAAGAPPKIDGVTPGNYFNAMVRPLAPFALRGVLWYQGESNIIATNDGVRYADKMQALVDSWRKIWAKNDLPFYSVQLAPYLYTRRKDPQPHGPDELPKLWEAQFLTLRLPHTAMVPTIDLDSNFGNIHPNGKRVVGQRLADLVLADTYGDKNILYPGPVFANLTITGNTAIVHFDGGVLASRDQKPLTEFEIAGADGQFVTATAVIKDDTVVVSSTQVAAPVAVRFAWRETAQPNLINKDGLPAYPFRTNGPDWHPAVTN